MLVNDVSSAPRYPLARLREFLRLEASGGILLMLAAVAALILANSPLGDSYIAFQRIPGSVQVGALVISKPLLLWVNDLWMALFFFLVGLEIKRELLEGQLADRTQLLLPAAAALGGIAVPAVIYWLANRASPETLSGWAIPAATDIAFALGVLALIGSRVPVSLKLLLTTIAVLDDLGAIVIIAAFYTQDLSIPSLTVAAVAVLGLLALNRWHVNHVAAYVLVGAILWVAVLKSGVHATLAGVITALAIPLRARVPEGPSLLSQLEHQLHPWVAYLILPTFAFANAGISFANVGLNTFLEPVTVGIGLGLLLGKQVGVFVPLWLCIKLRLAPMPAGANWGQLYAVALLCGVGFTMSLFIGGLAFEGAGFEAPVRLGVLGGSVLAALGGYLVMRLASRRHGLQSGAKS